MTGIFTKLKVWQLSHELTLEIYKITGNFPVAERYGLTAQLRRAAVAVPTNIAEGNARVHKREYLQYCGIARASIAEVEYLLRLGLDLGFIEPKVYSALSEGYTQVGRMLQGLINSLSA